MFQTVSPSSTLTMFCLPYAGGSAAIYREWAAQLPGWIRLVPLHMPGRGVRHGMQPMHQWPELLDLLVEDVQPHVTQPFAIFGHSMGALVGIELAHAIRRRYGLSPAWFGASACKAPARRELELHWLTCPEEEFLDEVRSLKGMPDELLENREFMELVLPFLRADFHLCGSYEYHQQTPLECPMLVIGGTQDSELAEDPQNLAAWASETTGLCEQTELEAGHFLINTHRDRVIDLVVDSLAKAFYSRGNPARRYGVVRLTASVSRRGIYGGQVVSAFRVRSLSCSARRGDRTDSGVCIASRVSQRGRRGAGTR